jgi:hypothetical protein
MRVVVAQLISTSEDGRLRVYLKSAARVDTSKLSIPQHGATGMLTLEAEYRGLHFVYDDMGRASKRRTVSLPAAVEAALLRVHVVAAGVAAMVLITVCVE